MSMEDGGKKKGAARLAPENSKLEAYMRTFGLIGIEDKLMLMTRAGFIVKEDKDEEGYLKSITVSKKDGTIIYFADLKELARIKLKFEQGKLIVIS